MKKWIVAAFIFTATLTFAQEQKVEKERLTPEQRTELYVKNMAMKLDLNDKQQKQFKALMLEQNQKREAARKDRQNRKEELKNLTADERFKMQNEAMDEEMAFRKKMKKILSEDQYEKWEALHERRKDKMKAHTFKSKGKGGAEMKSKKRGIEEK